MINYLALSLGVLAAIAILGICLAIFGFSSQRTLRDSLKLLPRYSKAVDESIDSGLILEESLNLLRIGRRIVRGPYLSFLKLRLEQAGNYGFKSLEVLLVRKVLFAAIGLGLGILMFGRGISMGLASLLVLTSLGFFVPDILLTNRGQNRATEIESGLPDAIDLLSLCVESGLSFEAAASRVSISTDGAVAEEFGALLAEMQLGKSRAQALESLVNRTKSAGLVRFASALLQVDRLGIPISAVLQEQASEMRRSRKDHAREQAQKVTVKILAPLMICLLPAVFIVVIGPALVTLFTGLAAIK